MTDEAGFVRALLNPALPPPPGLRGPQGRPAPRRFAVYRNNVAVGLRQALEDGFPVLRGLVGAEFFAAMAQVFLRANPPRSRILAQYGEDLPQFLAGFPPVAHLPYLADVARLELALRAAYHAADAEPLGAAALALPAGRMVQARLVLAPAVRLVRSAWPLWSIWAATVQGGPPPAPGAEDVLVVRPAFDPLPLRLPPGGAAFVAALAGGATVGDAVDAAGPDHPLAATLSLLATHGALVALHEEPPC
jgi:hypothetical protein